MDEDRFYYNGTRIDGFYAIYDRLNEDNTIWVDCGEEYLAIIINALNDK